MGNGNNGTTSVAKLLANEKAARVAHYKVNPTGQATTTVGRQALRQLEKAKAALVVATGQANFRLAAAKLAYAPQYAPRANGNATKGQKATNTRVMAKVRAGRTIAAPTAPAATTTAAPAVASA